MLFIAYIWISCCAPSNHLSNFLSAYENDSPLQSALPVTLLASKLNITQ